MLTFLSFPVLATEFLMSGQRIPSKQQSMKTKNKPIKQVNQSKTSTNRARHQVPGEGSQGQTSKALEAKAGLPNCVSAEGTEDLAPPLQTAVTPGGQEGSGGTVDQGSSSGLPETSAFVISASLLSPEKTKTALCSTVTTCIIQCLFKSNLNYAKLNQVSKEVP